MKIKVISSCKVDGEIHLPGAEIEPSDEDAQALIDSGACEAFGGESAKPESAEALSAAIRDAIATLDEDAFTQSGKAKVEAIETVLGYPVSAAERDAAMDAV